MGHTDSYLDIQLESNPDSLTREQLLTLIKDLKAEAKAYEADLAEDTESVADLEMELDNVEVQLATANATIEAIKGLLV
jgi:hypothetical protein